MDETTVLIVEDQLLIGWDLEGIVLDRGYASLGIVSNLRHVIQMAKQRVPDIALIDGNLDGDPTGMAVAAHLSQLGTRCIAVTANPEIFEKCDCIDNVVVKPFRDEQIATALYLSKVRIAGQHPGDNESFD